ncbi:MAG: signal peptide peptidase SppA [Proteobacteria bacterium]|nr:signal peptide peptidase SppA [Pseudomonadota bacterium]MBU1714921.1 signal peptide peptidase SppA [Pseudomonadota bacterium]
MTKRLFHQNHPILTGIFILGGIFIVCWTGITFFSSMFSPTNSPKADLFSKGAVGIIELKGIIVDPEQIIKDLVSFRVNNNIKAIVLRIDCPGGAVGASQEIFREVQRTDQTKPVIASMGSIAASGGYYAALGARKIMASRGTLTGSIGVIMKFANLEEIFQKIGYKAEVIKSGKLKDTGSSSRALTQTERNFLQNLIDNVHSQFVKDVGKARNLPEEKVRELADGRIFSGEQAKELGLIDNFGNFTDATMEAAAMANLKTVNPQLVYPERKKLSVFNLLAGEQGSALLDLIKPKYPILSYEWSLGR